MWLILNGFYFWLFAMDLCSGQPPFCCRWFPVQGRDDGSEAEMMEATRYYFQAGAPSLRRYLIVGQGGYE